VSPLLAQDPPYDRGESRNALSRSIVTASSRQQFERAVEICALKVRTDDAFVNNQHRDSPLCLRWILGAHAERHNLRSGTFVCSITPSERLVRGSHGQPFRVMTDNLLR